MTKTNKSKQQASSPRKPLNDPRASAPAPSAAPAPASAHSEAAQTAQRLSGREDDETISRRATAAEKAAQKAAAEPVTVSVPRGFNLTLDNHETVRYEAGTTEMPRGHAEHWYAKAHGVTSK